MPADAAASPFPWTGELHASATATAAAVPAHEPEPAQEAPEIDEAAIRAHVEALEREAFTKGYANGEREGAAAAAKRTDALIAKMSATLDELSALRAGVLHRTERDVVRVCMAMAEKILHRTLDDDPELLLTMARVAIDRLGDGVVATVHVHPDDHASLSAARARRPEVVSPAVAIAADPTVARGGCVVKSEFGATDLGLDVQMAELSRALLGSESAA